MRGYVTFRVTVLSDLTFHKTGDTFLTGGAILTHHPGARAAYLSRWSMVRCLFRAPAFHVEPVRFYPWGTGR